MIAATHRNLTTLVKEERFREDLYFRLDVLRLQVPALRERSEDIPALARHFLAQACQRAPLSPVRSISDAALAKLATMPWPGNVRQLASVIERAVVFGMREQIDVEQITALEQSGGTTNVPPWPTTSPWTLRELNRSYTEWVLYAWNRWEQGARCRNS